MVKLTDAILKAQQGSATNKSSGAAINRVNSRNRSTSQNSHEQGKNTNSVAANRPASSSKKLAPICITGDKLSLNYQEISSLQIDRQGLNQTQQSALAFQFAKVKKLFLSHNSLSSLDGIENFANLTHLSISHNKLMSVDELAKIGAQSALHGASNNSGKLQCLAVKGNFFLERHPDYKALVIRHFTGLRELDSQPLNPNGPNQSSLRSQVREGTALKHLIVPFVLKLDRSLQYLTAHLDGTIGSKMDRIDLVQKWSQVFNLKDFLQRGKIAQRTVTAQQLRSFIRTVDGILNNAGQQGSAPPLKVQRKELYDLFQWLYQEIILKLSSELKSTDLVKFLNFQILKKFPQLADFLNIKHQIDVNKQISQLDQRQVDRLCTLLDRDQQISLEMLLAEQLNAFYDLQPELSTLQDVSYEIAGIEVIDNVAGPDQDGSKSLPSNTMTSETQRMISQIATAVQKARGTNLSKSRSSSPNTLIGTRRMVVENSGGSALDHPVIIQNQRELIERSLKTHGTTIQETEFSFREQNEMGQSPGLRKFSPPRHGNSNEQSFLVHSQHQAYRAQSAINKDAVEKHNDSPLRYPDDNKPVLKSFFKIKQSAETEILPNRGGPTSETPSCMLLTEDMQTTAQKLQKPAMQSLKMNIPKNYFNQHVTSETPSSALGPDVLQSKSLTKNNSSAVSDSFQLSGQDPIVQAREQYQNMPEQKMEQAEQRSILARFLEDSNDEAALRETRSYLKDRILTQFPVFALNEDYMRALALIIMSKIERAKSIIMQLNSQIFYQQAAPAEDLDESGEPVLAKEEQSNLQNNSSLVSSGKPKKKLTEAERDKLSIIKRKLQEKKLQSAIAQERNSTRSRSVTFSEQFLSKSRSRSRGVSTGSKDSCFSPVNKHRKASGPRSQSGSLIRQQHASSAAALKNESRRVYGSGILREQSLEHQRLTDEQNAEIWVKKQQKRQQFKSLMKLISGKLDVAERQTKQQALYQWIRFAQRLHVLEHQLRQKHQAIHRQKVLYYWLAAFQQSVELTSGLRALQMKQKVWYQLVINRKQAQLSRAKIDTYYRQKLLLKSFYGFLKILEEHREQRRKQQIEADEFQQRQVKEEQERMKYEEQERMKFEELERIKFLEQQREEERKQILQSPIGQTASNNVSITNSNSRAKAQNNKFKRSAGSKSSKRKQSPNRKRNEGTSKATGLGLINVNPIIDKQIDGVYDLDVVDVQRSSYDEVSLIHGQDPNQPLLSAIQSQEELADLGPQEDPKSRQQQNILSQTFQENSHSHNALVYGQLTGLTQKQEPIPSAYFTKQVNFFKAGGGGSGVSFVQERRDTRGRRSQSREDLDRMNRRQSSNSATRAGKNRSSSREQLQTLNHAKRSILKKVYGSKDYITLETKKTQTKWFVQQQTQTDPMVSQHSNTQLAANANAQAETTLNDSFGKLMAERSRRNNETSSCLDLNLGSKPVTSGQSSAEKQKRKSSRGNGRIQLVNKSRDSRMRQVVTAAADKNSSALQHSRTEQSSLMTFRPSHVYTTQAKARQRTTRESSMSTEGIHITGPRKSRTNCGNLSKSIQDHEPKSYEKTTVSYVSKYLPQGAGQSSQPSGSSQVFKHLKNTTMSGNGDFFKSSASNKKLYQKLLVK